MQWKSLGLLELSALPSISQERWVPWVRDVEVLLVDGGEATYSCHWMRESGLADLLPSLPKTVWVGVSASSTAMALEAVPLTAAADNDRKRKLSAHGRWPSAIAGVRYPSFPEASREPLAL